MMENCMGGFAMGIMMIFFLALVIWFVVFSIIVLVKLARISKQLDKR